MNNNLITLSTCLYKLKSKFPINTYYIWVKNLLTIVNKFNLVIYTNRELCNQLLQLIGKSKKIKIIIKPIEDFYTYKYADNWINNHTKSNMVLHKNTDWQLNMLWNEKIFFVNDTIQHKYFDSLYYGWCDIGYFRNRPNDLHTKHLKNWPNPQKYILEPFETRIHYACVQNNQTILATLSNDIKLHYANKLETPPTDKYLETCFAGGFFILRPESVINYLKMYDAKLQYYFTNGYLIKDDQTIVMDIIFTNPNMFRIHCENNIIYDNWFMFQRLLL